MSTHSPTYQWDSTTGGGYTTTPNGDWNQSTGDWYHQQTYVVTPEPESPALTEEELRERMSKCVACDADCVWVLCDTCKLAVTELRQRVLESIARTIEEDLS